MSVATKYGIKSLDVAVIHIKNDNVKGIRWHCLIGFHCVLYFTFTFNYGNLYVLCTASA